MACHLFQNSGKNYYTLGWLDIHITTLEHCGFELWGGKVVKGWLCVIYYLT